MKSVVNDTDGIVRVAEASFLKLNIRMRCG